MISTPLPESAVAEYLTELAARVEPKGVKVGSYPRWGKKHNTVTLVGRYVLFNYQWLAVLGLLLMRAANRDKAFLESITPEVVHYVKGRLIKSDADEEHGEAGEGQA